MDKLIGGNDNGTQKMYGNDQDDIIYGGDGVVTSQELFGDFKLAGAGSPALGGNDRIFGGSDMAGDQTIAGGSFDDHIFSGNNVGGDIKIYGDNDGQLRDMEDALGFNINDGDDIIEVGNHNNLVTVYGQGGNDKIIGGWGASQDDRLYGGSGDDKIWLVNPEEREFDNSTN